MVNYRFKIKYSAGKFIKTFRDIDTNKRYVVKLKGYKLSFVSDDLSDIQYFRNCNSLQLANQNRTHFIILFPFLKVNIILTENCAANLVNVIIYCTS